MPGGTERSRYRHWSKSVAKRLAERFFQHTQSLPDVYTQRKSIFRERRLRR